MGGQGRAHLTATRPEKGEGGTRHTYTKAKQTETERENKTAKMKTVRSSVSDYLTEKIRG